MSPSSVCPTAFLAIGLVAVLGEAHEAPAVQAGVVVEEVSKGSAGEKAGIRAGDVLIAWERPANPPANPESAEGKIETPFDWMWVEMEQGPRGMVKVRGKRQDKEINFDVSAGIWGINVRPRFGDDALKGYEDGKAAVASKELQSGVSLWREVARSAETSHDSLVACWMSLKIGESWAAARSWTEARTEYEYARRMAAKAEHSVADAIVLETTARVLNSEGKSQESEAAHKTALAVREETGDSLSVARSLHQLGALANARRDGVAEGYYQRALSIREKFAPESLILADSLNALGSIAYARNELTEAEAYHKRALTIRQKLLPDSRLVATSLGNLGNVTWFRGELSTAESYYKSSRAILEKLAPTSLDMAACLSNLGNVVWRRGDLATAETYYRRALTIQEKLAPASREVASSLHNLGLVAHSRGDLPMAQTNYRRALTIMEKAAPDKLAPSLINLGEVDRERGELTSAEANYRRALSLATDVAPDSYHAAYSLTGLGNVARDRSDFVTAVTHYGHALAIREKLAPDSLDVASSLSRLGTVALKRQDLASAETYVKRALAIREKLSPGSIAEAESHHDLGRLYQAARRTEGAADHFRRAIDSLEAQIGKLGGTQEAQSGFGAQHTDYYHDYIDLLVDQDQPAEAFRVLERSRARTLLAMLAERDLVFTSDVPEEVERERKAISAEYDQTQARLGRLNPAKDQSQAETQLNRLRELRERQSAIVDRIRQQSPRLASLQYPQPLDVKGVTSALDAGTMLLSYSVGKEKTHLFALSAGTGVQAYTLAIGETQLREEVERFRGLIQRAQLGATDVTGLVDRGKHLYGTLIEPAARQLAAATRVLVIPDGPLHALPFAALVRGLDTQTAGGQRAWQYLVEWKPLHVVVSATVYAELRKERQKPGAKDPAKTLIAFGDPAYPSGAAADDGKALETQDAVLRSIVTRGVRLTPLPATKSEVAAIADLYGEKAATYVGVAATEERAKSVTHDAKYLHFASHGLLDERFPLNSGLALTIPNAIKEGQDNGILQAWEIFEGMRIDADLVVLSACETGLGKEMGGEGLVGLTRAFEYAGARSVLASLWSVSDDTTAALMKQLYGYLKAGKTKDDALRHAQLDLIRRTVAVANQDVKGTRFDASHPFYWAAFQLNGDWR